MHNIFNYESKLRNVAPGIYDCQLVNIERKMFVNRYNKRLATSKLKFFENVSVHLSNQPFSKVSTMVIKLADLKLVLETVVHDLLYLRDRRFQ